MRTALNVLSLLILLLLRLCGACPGPEAYRDFFEDINSSILLGRDAVNGSWELANDIIAPQNMERWYSVMDLDVLQQSNRVTRTVHGPWPVHCGVQYVRICFQTQHAYENLIDHVARAAALWAPASRYSGMMIQPSIAGCYFPDQKRWEWHCICGPHTDEDALVIDDRRDDENQIIDDATGSTVGYDYTSQTRGRHELSFGAANNPAPDHMTAAEQNQYLAVTLAHEFGHAIGLWHEHQRPDRDTYIDFKCQAVKGYEAAEHLVRAEGLDQPAIDAKMKQICNSYALATQYGFDTMFEFLKGNQDPTMVGGGEWPEQETFDYASIMIYGSWAFRRRDWLSDANLEALNVPLVRKFSDKDWQPAVTWRDHLLFQGGASYPRYEGGSVSWLDVGRVMAMYPPGPEQQQNMVDDERTFNGGHPLTNWPPQTFSIFAVLNQVVVRAAPLRVVNAQLRPI